MRYILRQATDKDKDILNRIHAENMRGYVEKVYPWDSNLFSNSFIPEEYQIVATNQNLIGFIKVVVSETDIYLAEIQIAKPYQKKGVGTSLIQSVINQATLQNKRLWLKVIKNNPAQNLYRKLGFISVEELLHHKIMEYTN